MIEENQISQQPAGSGQPDPALVKTVTTAVLTTLQATGTIPEQTGGQGGKEQEPEKTIDLVGLFFHILERFWVVLLCAVIGASFMGWRAGKAVPLYTATAKLYIVNPDSTGINIMNLQLGTVLTFDYQEVFRTWEVHQMVIEELGLPFTYEQMQGIVSVMNPEDTRILYISATFPDPEMAAKIANAYAKAAKTFIINTMKGEPPSEFSIALEPSIGRAVSRSNRMILGFLGGSVLAVGLLTLGFILDNGPRSPESIRTFGGISTLAVFPASKKNKDKNRDHKRRGGSEKSPTGKHFTPRLEITNFPELDFVSSEAMNTLSTNLSYCGQGIRKIMITSRYAGEGKSYVTMNLMRTLAQLGRSVVVVDTDLRVSGIQTEYRLHYNSLNHSGLSEYLSGLCSLDDVLYETDIPNAFVIPAGHEAPNPLQLLDTQRMKETIDWLSQQFDIVLLDTPPVGVLVDAVALGKYCDGAVLVVGYRKGKQQEIREAVNVIRQTGCRILGAVLNGVKFHTLSNRHYYYHSERYASNYNHGYYDKKKKKA